MNTTKRPAELLATLGADKLAALLVDMALPAGTQTEWDSETIEYVLNPLEATFKELGIPGVGNTGADDEALIYWRVEEQRQDNPNWVYVNHFIDLGQRNTETGYVDSIKLIHEVLTQPLELSGKTELKAQLDKQLESDLIEIDDSGNDLDTMTDLLEEWQDRAYEAGLSAYADGEAGLYRVTNITTEED